MNYLQYSVNDLSRRIRSREVRIADIVAASLDRAEALQQKHNTFIELFRDKALRQATVLQAEVDKGQWRGPLHGIPLAYKDCFSRKDRLPTVGSKVPITFHAVDAYVISVLEAKGAIDLGALNLSEMCAGPSGLNEHFGDCANAWDPARVSGGSSSGSAVSVASYQVYGSLGTDTGGSVRIPASMNGIYALKPTFGLISNSGCFPRAFSLDCIGPLARSIEDCEIIFDQLIGQQTLKNFDSTCSTTKFAALDTNINVHPFIEKQYNNFLDLIMDDFYISSSAKFRDIDVCYVMGDIIAKCEAATLHKKWMDQYPSYYSSEVYSRTEIGLHISASMYIEAVRSRAHIVHDFIERSFVNADILVTPSMPIPTPLIADVKCQGDVEAAQEMIKRLTLLTRPFNYLGLPVLSMPIGIDDNGMPIGVQLIGRPFEEKRLFGAAQKLAGIIGFKGNPYH